MKRLSWTGEIRKVPLQPSLASGLGLISTLPEELLLHHDLLLS